MTVPFEIFLVVAPGLEDLALAEVQAADFPSPSVVPGGVVFQGGWAEIWRANLVLRCVDRVLARIGGFPVFHLAQLDKRARKFDWGAILHKDVPVRVEVTCRKSKIYHAGAAKQRIETALTDSFGATLAAEAPLRLLARIEDNFCTFSIDTSGAPLHKRGYKQAVAKAPMRETLAALFLRQCGFTGQEPVVDPMCGSGTFVIEAAAMACGRAAGADRSFAFEDLVGFDRDVWFQMKAQVPRHDTDRMFHGFDRDQGAIGVSQANAARAGVAEQCRFDCQPISALTPPKGAPGLVIVNPPYGARIGNKKVLFGLYAALGQVLKAQFAGWRVGVVTSEPGLAKATGLPFLPPGPPVPLGGLKIKLYRTDAL